MKLAVTLVFIMVVSAAVFDSPSAEAKPSEFFGVVKLKCVFAWEVQMLFRLWSRSSRKCDKPINTRTKCVVAVCFRTNENVIATLPPDKLKIATAIIIIRFCHSLNNVNDNHS